MSNGIALTQIVLRWAMGAQRAGRHWLDLSQKPSRIALLSKGSRISAWLATLIFFIVLSIVAAAVSRQQRQESYETGFQTDFSMSSLYKSIDLVLYLNMRTLSKFSTLTEAAWSKIALVQYPFTGGIKLGNNNQTFYREISPGPQYVGTPSPAIDRAWGELLQGELRLFHHSPGGFDVKCPNGYQA